MKMTSTTMQLFTRIQAGPIRNKWHWLNYNFNPITPGFRSVGVPTIRALDTVDQHMPGYAHEQLKRLEGLSGRENDMGHYQQIVAWYAELLVLLQLASHHWPSETRFAMEPVAHGSKANPEVVISLEGIGSLGVEVKTPDLTHHRVKRATLPTQLNSRSSVFKRDSATTPPRDGPVKDFLVHADKKFRGFRADPRFSSILVIVWDDHVYEPVTALTSQASGLFTPNSFHQKDKLPMSYPSIDGVLLVRHQHQIIRGLGGEHLIDGRQNLLDYGRQNEFPFPAMIKNPAGRPIPAQFNEALNAVAIEKLNGAEYRSTEIVKWVDC